MKEIIKERLKDIPDKPGIYQMIDTSGQIIYIGKAKSLKNRVKSYFSTDAHSPKITVMIPKINYIDFITTDNEVEALLLEDTLIKKHQPRYNTLLKDDKKFPWIEITDEDYPRILVTRKPSRKSKNKKTKYFGPYVNAGALYATIDFLKQVFPLKQCKTPVFKNKPCMNYHIHRCLGPCQELVTPDEYKQVLRQVELFLSGKQTELLKKLEQMMKKASENLEFEKAAKYRDTINSIEKVIETQKIISTDKNIEQDVLSYANDDINISIVIFKIREGKLIYKEAFDLLLEELDTPQDLFIAFIQNYYRHINTEQIPKELILPIINDDIELMSAVLSKKKGSKVKPVTPKARKKYELLKMAKANAEISLQNIQLKNARSINANWNEIGVTIQNKLKLEHFPFRIECFDISHLSGTNTVASMVVFEKGKPKKSDYRKFKIKSLEGAIDDFASMEEVLERRYKKLISEKKELPGLILIDGGKGQLSSAEKALHKLGIKDPPLASIAKKFEELFIPGQKEPIIFDKNSPVLYLFQQVRDEAHRFAISFQRNLRNKKMTTSFLDNLISVGKKRKALLIKHFGNPDAILNASIEDLQQVEGINEKLAGFIFKQVQEHKNSTNISTPK